MGNLRGIALMIFAMALFAVEDMFVKFAVYSMPLGQLLVLLGIGAAGVFAVILKWQGTPVWSSSLLSRPVIVRNLSEMVGTGGWLSAITLMPFSNASAIQQATPLAVTLGAAMFLGEHVGWRRWSAILVGFVGVLLIVQPGLDGFNPAALLAVLGVCGLASRDVVTRTVPSDISSLQLSLYGFAALVPLGCVMLALTGPATPMTLSSTLFVIATILTGAAGYYAIVAAMRVGDVSVVAPFRYSRLIFALLIGMIIFNERLDHLSIVGCLLIIGSGLYMFWREHRLRKTKMGAA